MSPPPPSRPADSPRPPLRDRRRRRDRRVLAIGLGVSFFLHLLAIGLIGGWLHTSREPMRARSAPVLIEPPQGLRVMELSVVPGEPDLADAPPEPEEEAERGAPAVVVAAPAVRDTAPADARTAADRLAPRVVDPRLWRPMILLPRDPTFEDVEARIAEAVELMSDSALADAEAAMRAVDWTFTDSEGGRWGISPGKLHLGSVTLPLPIVFAPDAATMESNRQWYELERQLERARIMESFEDRVRAIRERRERERAEARERGSGGG